ncbi:MAG: hypothetical protein KJ799_02340 [Bacteroidetes bacterium]|nr:hypothetical protein [Bacteroidota bacterium]
MPIKSRSIVLFGILIAMNLLTEPILSQNLSEQFADIKLTDHPYAEYPDLSVDSENNVWVVFIEMIDEKEQITLLKIVDSITKDSFNVSEYKGNEFKPRIFCDKDDVLWIVWSAKRESNWNIVLRKFDGENFSDEIILSESNSNDFRPAIAGNKNGEVLVAWESLSDNSFDIQSVLFNKDGKRENIKISSSDFMDLRPTVFASEDGKFLLAWDRQIENSYQIFFKEIAKGKLSDEFLISPEYGYNQAPSITQNKDGVFYIAWHSNIQPPNKIGLVPWVNVAEFKSVKNIKYYSLAENSDWEKAGEDQGFEFPTLIASKNMIHVFGRTSQGFAHQSFQGKDKSEFEFINVSGWGGRGQYVRSALDNDGNIVTVRRDIKSIYLRKFEAVNESLQISKLNRVLFSAEYEYIFELPKTGKERISNADYQILFGDIHQHSSISDGMGTADLCFTRSKYLYHYDFASLTDHEWFTQNRILPSEWEWIKTIGNYFERKTGLYVFAAYEWTSARVPKGFGHKNAYFQSWDKEIYSLQTNAKNTNELFTLLKKDEAVAIPHHIGWTGVDWENHDPQVQTAVEIVSEHGAFEYMGNEPIMHRGGMPGYFVQDGLSKGLKFGIIGSSDGHGLRWHHGVGSKEDPWQNGLTGILVKSSSKESAYKALMGRMVYATSGSKIQLAFSIQDSPMGSEITLAEAPEIKFEVIGTDKLHKVILVKDNLDYLILGRDIYDGRGIRYSFTDETPERGKHFYYLRVIQENGEMAWSSPIWVDYKTD